MKSNVVYTGISITMTTLFHILLLSAVAGFLGTSAIELASDQENMTPTVEETEISPDRLLSGVSRRKYLPNHGGALVVPSAYKTTMDDEEDDDEDEEDDEDGDFHHFNAATDGSVARAAESSAAEGKEADKHISSENQEAKNKPLLMGSLPAQKETANVVPKSASDIISSYFDAIKESFHNMANQFFDNIDKQLEKNRSLPILEHGDTFF